MTDGNVALSVLASAAEMHQTTRTPKRQQPAAGRTLSEGDATGISIDLTVSSRESRLLPPLGAPWCEETPALLVLLRSRNPPMAFQVEAGQPRAPMGPWETPMAGRIYNTCSTVIHCRGFAERAAQ